MRKKKMQSKHRSQQRRARQQPLPRPEKLNGGSLSADPQPELGLLASLFGPPSPPSPQETIQPGTTNLSSEEAVRAEAFEQAAAQVPPVITEAAGSEPAPPAPIPAAPGESLDLQPDTVALYVRTTFDFLAKMDHPIWKLEEVEVRLIAPPATPVANKWLHKLMGDSPYREELALALVLLAVLWPRCLARFAASKKPSEVGTTTPAFSVSRAQEKVI